MEKLILALNNYRLMMRLLFPGYLGAEAFFAVWLERIMDKDLPPLTAEELNDAFVEHLNKKSTASNEGLPPPTFTEVQAAAGNTYVTFTADFNIWFVRQTGQQGPRPQTRCPGEERRQRLRPQEPADRRPRQRQGWR